MTQKFGGGFGIGVVTENYPGNEDRRWLGTRLTEQWMPRSFMLDVSALLPAHVSAKGGVPSGIALAARTSAPAGFLVPYDPAAGIAGADTCVGLLWSTTQVNLVDNVDVGIAVFWAGVVKTAFLPTFVGTTIGTLDAAGKADIANFVRFE